MNIPKEQLAGKPKKIGRLRDMDVMEASVVGGLHMVFAVTRGGGTETLGLGSHRTIARHIAKKQNPSLELTELSKSEDLPSWIVEQLSKNEGAETLTAQIRAVEMQLEAENGD